MPNQNIKSIRFLLRNSSVLLFNTLLLHLLLAVGSFAEEPRFLEGGNSAEPRFDLGYLPIPTTRVKLDLSGPWNYIIEGGQSGKVQVPSAYDFQGRVTFERTFDVSPEMLDRYRFHLVMLGVNYSCDVYINGEFILNHAGGYTSVLQPLPEKVLQVGKENNIRVDVNNALDGRSTLPLRVPVWGIRNYGGITRDIFLLGTPGLCIKDVIVRTEYPDSKGAAKIFVAPSVDGQWTPKGEGKERESLGFTFQVIDRMTGAPVAQSAVVPLTQIDGEWRAPEAEVSLATPKLWAPKTPELYLLRCRLVLTVAKISSLLDEYDLNAGIRTVNLSNGDIVLNGKRVILNGVVWYEDHPTWGSAMTYEERERDIVLIKNLGANAVRFVHHPPDPYMLDLCDRYGLLALVELPVVQAPGSVLGQESYADLAHVALKEMIVRDRTHPSVLAWGLGSDIESSHPAARRFMESLVDLARSLDTRPTYIATGIVDGDSCTDVVDIAALNVSTHDPKAFQATLDSWRKSHRTKPVILTRFGTEVQQENRNGYSDPLSQEAQARYYIQRFDMLRAADFDGAFVWSFNDWRGDHPSLTVRTGDPSMHTMGLVSSRREKRLAYDAVRAVFHGEKFAALPIGSYSMSAPIIYVVVGFVVLIGMAYFYNANRRFRENLNRSILNSYNFFSDVRDQHLVPVLHSTILGLVVSLATAIVLSSIFYHFRSSLFLDSMLSYLLVSDGLKRDVVRLIWNPLKCIASCSVALFLVLCLISCKVYLLRVLFKTRIYFFHAYSVTMWATPPLLVLIPAGMILFRIMESSIYVLPSLAVLAGLHVWVLLRLLKGISIVYDVLPFRVYVLGFLSLALACVLVYFYYDVTQSAPLYASFLYKLVGGGR